MSTREQALSPAAQRDRLAAWAAKENHVLAEVFHDVCPGRSAPGGRDGLLRALRALQRGTLLVAVRRDRFARDTLVAAQISAMVRRAGGVLTTVDGPSLHDSPETRLFTAVIDAVAEFEADVLRARTRAALQAKLARGEPAGGVPALGTRIEGGRLVPDRQELAAVARAQALRQAGLGFLAITIVLRREGFVPRGRSWHPSSLARAVRRLRNVTV